MFSASRSPLFLHQSDFSLKAIFFCKVHFIRLKSDFLVDTIRLKSNLFAALFFYPNFFFVFFLHHPSSGWCRENPTSARERERAEVAFSRKRVFWGNSVCTLACCEWCAETPGLKPLRLSHARKMSQSLVSRNSNIERRMDRPKAVVGVIMGVA